MINLHLKSSEKQKSQSNRSFETEEREWREAELHQPHQETLTSKSREGGRQGGGGEGTVGPGQSGLVLAAGGHEDRRRI